MICASAHDFVLSRFSLGCSSYLTATSQPLLCVISHLHWMTDLEVKAYLASDPADRSVAIDWRRHSEKSIAIAQQVLASNLAPTTRAACGDDNTHAANSLHLNVPVRMLGDNCAFWKTVSDTICCTQPREMKLHSAVHETEPLNIILNSLCQDKNLQSLDLMLNSLKVGRREAGLEADVRTHTSMRWRCVYAQSISLYSTLVLSCLAAISQIRTIASYVTHHHTKLLAPRKYHRLQHTSPCHFAGWHVAQSFFSGDGTLQLEAYDQFDSEKSGLCMVSTDIIVVHSCKYHKVETHSCGATLSNEALHQCAQSYQKLRHREHCY